jgi:hypothetical protein
LRAVFNPAWYVHLVDLVASGTWIFTHRMQFIYLQVPGISSLEWHPFSVASSAEDPYIALYVRVLGDWTHALGQLVASQLQAADWDTPCLPASIPARVDGPFGAPTMQYQQYTTVAFVALGIGISPFLAILRHELHTRRSRPLAVRPVITLLWVVRTLDHLQWLVTLLTEFEDVVAGSGLDVQIFLTAAGDHELYPSAPGLRIHDLQQRPEWSELITSWLASSDDASVSSPPPALFICGSPTATSAIKQAVACLSRPVDIYTEAFH